MKRIFAIKKVFSTFICLLALGGATVFAQITVNDGETKSTDDGTGAITVNPGGTFQLSGSQTIAPATYPTFTLVGAADGSASSAPRPNIFNESGNNIIDTDIAITGRYTYITANPGSTLTLTGTVGRSGGGAQINFRGGGEVITTGTAHTSWVTIEGATWTVDGGTLNVYGNTSISSSGNYQWNLNNATINPGGKTDANIAINPNATLSGTLTLAVTEARTLTLNGVLSGTGGITKTDTGTVVLTKNNTYSGPTAVQAGTLRIAGNSALDGDITITSGQLQIAGNLSGNGTIYHNGASGIENRILLENATVDNDFVINSASTTAWTGAVYVPSGSSTINGDIVVKRGVGSGGHLATAATGATLYLNGALDVNGTNTISHRNGVIVYSGGGSTTYNLNVVGTAKLGADNGLATGVSMALGASGTGGDNGTFDLSGYNQTLARVTKSTQNATITNTAAAMSTLTLNTTAANDYAGIITGNLSLVKAGDATLTISGTASHTGTTTVSGGTLNMGSNSYNAGSYVVENGASLIFAGGTRAHTSTDLIAFGDGGGTVQINGGNFYSNVNQASQATRISTAAGTPDDINYAVITDNGAGNTSRGINMNNRNWTFDVAENSVLTLSTRIGNTSAAQTFTKAGEGEMVITDLLTWGGDSQAFGSKLAVTGGKLTLNHIGETRLLLGGISISDGATLVLDPQGSGEGIQLATVTLDMLTFGEGGGTLEILGRTNFQARAGNNGDTFVIATTEGKADDIYHSRITGSAGINLHNRTLEFQVAKHSELDITTRFWNDSTGVKFTGDGTVNFASNFAQAVNLTSDVARLNFQDGDTTTAGSLTVNSGIFSPGGGASDPFGQATIAGGLNLASGATLLLEIGGESGWDQLFMQSLGSFADDANLVISVLDNYVASDDPMVIFTGDTTSGFGQQLVGKLDEALAGYRFLDYSVDAGMVSLTTAAVPEPATWVLLLMGGGLLLTGVRRGCRK